MRTVTLADREIGNGHPVFIIAEAGINHNGDIDIARKLILKAGESGADAIKFQSFQADKICNMELTETKDVEGITGGTKSSYDMYKGLELSDDDHRFLFNFAAENNILFFSSVFDEERVDFLNELGVPAFKTASSDITYMSLIKKVAATGKPVLISTGMSTLDEVASAVGWCHDEGNENIILFHCSCMYPPPDDELNLNAMITMRESFSVPVGYSDHTSGTAIPIAAAAMGANIIEKHFTLARDMPGPDQALSLEPGDFGTMVDGIRTVEKAKGSYIKAPSEGEMAGLVDGRRSIMAGTHIPAGTVIAKDMLKILKPATGLRPANVDLITGRRVKVDIKKQQPITEELIEGVEKFCEESRFARS